MIADIRRSLSMVLERNAIPIELHERGYGMRIAAIPDSDLAKRAGIRLMVLKGNPH